MCQARPLEESPLAQRAGLVRVAGLGPQPAAADGAEPAPPPLGAGMADSQPPGRIDAGNVQDPPQQADGPVDESPGKARPLGSGFLPAVERATGGSSDDAAQPR